MVGKAVATRAESEGAVRAAVVRKVAAMAVAMAAEPPLAQTSRKMLRSSGKLVRLVERVEMQPTVFAFNYLGLAPRRRRSKGRSGKTGDCKFRKFETSGRNATPTGNRELGEPHHVDAKEGVPLAHGECGPVRARDIRHCPLEPSPTRAAASCELKSVDVQPGPGDG